MVKVQANETNGVIMIEVSSPGLIKTSTLPDMYSVCEYLSACGFGNVEPHLPGILRAEDWTFDDCPIRYFRISEV